MTASTNIAQRNAHSSGYAVASLLPDIFPPFKERGKLSRFLTHHQSIVIGGGILLLLILIAIMAPLLAHSDPGALNISKRLRPPSAQFWFGTDMQGRDIYSRVLYGARASLIVGFSVALVATVLGMFIGMVAGFVRLFDGVIMRVMDSIMSIPSVLLAIALMAITRGSMVNVIIAISVAEVPRVARLVRSVVLSLRELPYVEGAVASGSRAPAIIMRHIMPNTFAPLIVQATYICASAMVTESILSFIGAGMPTYIPSWGNIMADGRALWQAKFYIIAFPAAFLSLTVLAVNLLGDGLRDALDPRMNKGG